MADKKQRWHDLDALGVANRIHELGLATARIGSIDEVVRAVVERIQEDTDADYVGIALVDATAGRIRHKWARERSGRVVPEGFSLALGEGITGRVAATGEPMCVSDVRDSGDYVPFADGIRSELCVPLKVGDSIIGVLDAESHEPNRFGPTELAIFRALATPVARAIDNARLLEVERDQRALLQKLYRVSEAITSTVDLEALLARAVESIRDEFGYEFVAIGLLDDDGGHAVLRAASAAVTIDLPVGYRQPVGVGVVGEVMASGESLLVVDVRERKDYVAASPTLRSEMCVPLVVEGRRIGFIDAEATAVGAFDETDVLVLYAVAKHIAQAVENARNLLESSRLREELSRMIIHDLRSPLTVVQSVIEMLRLKSGGDRMLDSATAACDRMAIMLEAYLELQRLESGGLDLAPRQTSARELLEPVGQRMEIVARNRQVELVLEIAADGLAIRADVELITRVVENLLLNALRFTPSGGRVVVTSRAAAPELLVAMLPGFDGGLHLTVSDTGPGIPKGDLEHIFDQFASVRDGDVERPRRGSGLGLAFCRQAIRAHRGAVWAESAKDAGATFHVLLPAV